jgi:hypothetical protein
MGACCCKKRIIDELVEQDKDSQDEAVVVQSTNKNNQNTETTEHTKNTKNTKKYENPKIPERVNSLQSPISKIPQIPHIEVQKTSQEWFQEYESLRKEYSKQGFGQKYFDSMQTGGVMNGIGFSMIHPQVEQENHEMQLKMDHALNMWRKLRIEEGVVDRSNDQGEYYEVTLGENCDKPEYPQPLMFYDNEYDF